jgi:hypothetical protein
MAPGRGPVKIAAALTIAAAGFGGGFAYKRFRRYLNERKLRKKREESRQAPASEKQQKAKSGVRKRSATQKRPRPRKKTATKSKQKSAEPKINEDLS